MPRDYRSRSKKMPAPRTLCPPHFRTLLRCQPGSRQAAMEYLALVVLRSPSRRNSVTARMATRSLDRRKSAGAAIRRNLAAAENLMVVPPVDSCASKPRQP